MQCFGKGSSAARILSELCLTYCSIPKSEGKVRQCCEGFGNGRTNVHDEERRCRLRIQFDDFVEYSKHTLRNDRKLTTSAPVEELSPVGRTSVYMTVTGKLGYHNLCARG